MLTLPAAVRIYVAAAAVDLRRGFDGLAAATRQLIGADPLSGHLFVFLNRRRNRVKLLVWDRTGICCSTSGWSGGPSGSRRRRGWGSGMWSSTAASSGSCWRGWTCGAPAGAGAGIGRPAIWRRRRVRADLPNAALDGERDRC
jgi:hypothetical protein